MYFFFQAEDGIRDYKVTGVQTCALPISIGGSGQPMDALTGKIIFTYGGHSRTWGGASWNWQRGYYNSMLEDFGKIGRASCRERVASWALVSGVNEKSTECKVT